MHETMSLPKAAAYMGLKKRTLSRLIRQGKIAAIDAGYSTKKVHYILNKKAIDAFMENMVKQ